MLFLSLIADIETDDGRAWDFELFGERDGVETIDLILVAFLFWSDEDE